MVTYQCPACAAPLLEGSAMCSVCKSDIDWHGGRPEVTSAGRALGRVAIYVLIALIAAGLVLAATVLFLANM